MTSRKRFERWAKRNGLPLGRGQEVTRNGVKLLGYSDHETRIAWLAWEAGIRASSATRD